MISFFLPIVPWGSLILVRFRACDSLLRHLRRHHLVVIEAECAAGKPQFSLLRRMTWCRQNLSPRSQLPKHVQLQSAFLKRLIIDNIFLALLLRLHSTWYANYATASSAILSSLSSQRGLWGCFQDAVLLRPVLMCLESIGHCLHWKRLTKPPPCHEERAKTRSGTAALFTWFIPYHKLKEETRCFWHPQFRCTMHSPCPIGSVEGFPGIRGWESFEAANQRAEWNEVRQCLPGCICSDICIGRVRTTQNCWRLDFAAGIRTNSEPQVFVHGSWHWLAQHCRGSSCTFACAISSCSSACRRGERVWQEAWCRQVGWLDVAAILELGGGCGADLAIPFAGRAAWAAGCKMLQLLHVYVGVVVLVIAAVRGRSRSRHLTAPFVPGPPHVKHS